MLTLTRNYLARAAATALTGQRDPAVIIVEGIGVLDRDTVCRAIVAIGPALLTGNRDDAVELAANALRPLPPHPDPADVAIRDLEARAFVAWFAGLAVEAAFDDTPRGVVATRDPDDPHRFRLVAVGTAHTATLRPGGPVCPWLIETFTAGVPVSRCEVYQVEVDDALHIARGGLHTLLARRPGTTTTPCGECGRPISDDAPSVIDAAHAAACSLHPWGLTDRRPIRVGQDVSL